MSDLNTSLSNKISALEESVMSNATISEIYENARNRIVNSALGKALGMTSDTEILDAAVSIESVVNNGSLSNTFIPSASVQTYTIPKGYTSGGTVTCNAKEPTRTVISTNADTWTTLTFNINAFTDNYKNLTVDNFAILPKSLKSHNRNTGNNSGGGGDTEYRLTFGGTPSYNAGTGVLTVPYISGGNWSSGNSEWTGYSFLYDVLMYT